MASHCSLSSAQVLKSQMVKTHLTVISTGAQDSDGEDLPLSLRQVLKSQLVSAGLEAASVQHGISPSET